MTLRPVLVCVLGAGLLLGCGAEPVKNPDILAVEVVPVVILEDVVCLARVPGPTG